MITPAVFLTVMNHVLKTASRADYFSGLLVPEFPALVMAAGW